MGLDSTVLLIFKCVQEIRFTENKSNESFRGVHEQIAENSLVRYPGVGELWTLKAECFHTFFYLFA